eukprot:Rmarinus@m.2942
MGNIFWEMARRCLSSMILVLLLFLWVLTTTFALSGVSVDVKQQLEWKQHHAFIASPAQERDQVSRFGGYKGKKLGDATGYFTKALSESRWWLQDPEGYAFLSIGVNAVRPGVDTASQKARFESTFRSDPSWAAATHQVLTAVGVNTLGGQSAVKPFADPIKLPYVLEWDFMNGFVRFFEVQDAPYKPTRDILPIFDPRFRDYARQTAETKLVNTLDDRYLIGHISDNGLPLSDTMLDDFLALPSDHPNRQSAEDWLKKLRARLQVYPDAKILEEERVAFAEYATWSYFRIVGLAIRKVDRNHMYLGCNFRTGNLRSESFFSGCSRPRGHCLSPLSWRFHTTPKTCFKLDTPLWQTDPCFIVLCQGRAGGS